MQANNRVYLIKPLAANIGDLHCAHMPAKPRAALGLADLRNSAPTQELRAELTRARTVCRAWAETVNEHQRKDKAGLFVRLALEHFAASCRPGISLSAAFHKPYGSLDHVAEQLAQTIGREAASLPLVEGLHFITSLYPAMLPGRTRGELGAFYTPPCLVERLTDLAAETGADWTKARVLDPAVGAGAFLVSAALRMLSSLQAISPAVALRQIGSRLLGLEIDPVAAGLAQASVEVVLHDLAKAAGRKVPTLVQVCNSLDMEPEAKFDLVIGNPPYGRVALTADQRTRFSRSLYGHANLYGVFTDLALRWAKPGGHIAFLTPTSFLAGQYFSALRRLLAAEAPPVAIDFVNARRGVFEDVLQETVLTVFARGAKPKRAQVHYLNVLSETEADVVRNGTIGLPGHFAAPWLAPRTPQHSRLIKTVEGMDCRLADYGYGVSTGPLVWNRHKGQLRSHSGSRDVLPLIWAECVSPDGRFVFRALKRNHAPYFKLEAGDAWLRVETPCVLLQRTTAKEQARRLIAAELPEAFIRQHGGVVVENHLNMIWLRGDPIVTPRVLAALLNSQIVDQVFRCMSGSVAVSAFELEHLPLPEARQLGRLTKLVASDRPDLTAIATEIDRLYGWQPE